MAKAKLVRRKRKLRIQGLATLLFTIAVFAYMGAKFGVKSYNIILQKQAQTVETQVSTLRDAIANLEAEVNILQSRDRVLGMAEEEGIKTNQDNVVVIENENK